MASDIQGRYYSETLTSASANYDLMDIFRERLAIPATAPFVAKKVTLISSGSASISVNVNNVGNATLFENADGNRVLNLDGKDVLVSSLKVVEASASSIFLAIVY